MTCTECIEQLLEADPETLAGTGMSPVAEHIASCAQCRRVATKLLAAHDRDSSAYLGIQSRKTADAVATRVIVSQQGSAVRRLSIVRQIRWGLVPLAAAAVLFLTLVTRQNSNRVAAITADSLDVAARPSVLSVRVPPGKNAVVFKTRDPLISVVWIY